MMYQPMNNPFAQPNWGQMFAPSLQYAQQNAAAANQANRPWNPFAGLQQGMQNFGQGMNRGFQQFGNGLSNFFHPWQQQQQSSGNPGLARDQAIWQESQRRGMPMNSSWLR